MFLLVWWRVVNSSVKSGKRSKVNFGRSYHWSTTKVMFYFTLNQFDLWKVIINQQMCILGEP